MVALMHEVADKWDVAVIDLWYGEAWNGIGIAKGKVYDRPASSDQRGLLGMQYGA